METPDETTLTTSRTEEAAAVDAAVDAAMAAGKARAREEARTADREAAEERRSGVRDMTATEFTEFARAGAEERAAQVKARRRGRVARLLDGVQRDLSRHDAQRATEKVLSLAAAGDAPGLKAACDEFLDACERLEATRYKREVRERKLERARREHEGPRARLERLRDTALRAAADSPSPQQRIEAGARAERYERQLDELPPARTKERERSPEDEAAEAAAAAEVDRARERVLDLVE